MEGIFFYWFSWFMWTFATFIMKKNKYRTYVAFGLLVCIIFIQKNVYIVGMTFTLSFIAVLLLVYSYIGLQKLTKILYLLIITMMVAMAYVGLELLALYDPVIILFQRNWLIAAFVIMLILVTVRDPIQRGAVLIAGMGQGEMIHALFLREIYVHKLVGSLAYFDIIASAFFLLVAWQFIEKAVQLLGNHVTTVENTGTVKY